MAKYNLQQQTFTLSMLSNLVAGVKDTPQGLQKALETRIDALLGCGPVPDPNAPLVPYLGTWEVVWGPRVYTADTATSPVADQAVFVARGTDPASGRPTFVVAIAGTNFASAFDEKQEDASLAPPVAIPLGSNVLTSKGHVTHGTATGLRNILDQMSDPVQGPLAGFLARAADPGAILIFTGHSLGGALAPALALDLFPTATAAQAWGDVWTLPTAGPTVTNAGFVTSYARAFPAQAQSGSGLAWNANVVNTLDIVPMAWHRLGDIKGVYAGQITDPTTQRIIDERVLAAEVYSALFVLGFAEIPRTTLNGAFFAPAAAPLPLTYWITEAIYQHVWAYFDLLAVTEVRDILGMKSPFDADSPMASAVEGACKLLAGRNASTLCSACQPAKGAR